MRQISESEQALHELIRQAEDMARELRVLSSGYLSLAVVRNHGKSLAEREGLGWHDAHEAAVRVFTAPDSVTDAVLAAAAATGTPGKDSLIQLLGHLAADGLGDATRERQRARARELAEELYKCAQYDLGARILPLVRELHETRDITAFIAKVPVWIAQPAEPGPGASS